MGAIAKGRLVDRSEHLGDGLLDHASQYRGYTKSTLGSVRFWTA